MPRGLLGLVDPSARDDVLRTVHAELVDRYEDGVGIRVGASVWVVTARASLPAFAKPKGRRH